ncbi:S41 family peptidase [Vibrio spartinae]|uniref:Carboxy-terminal protease n=1 Tax=Vibrio spartinae TaxID=1918945 RepID=A0A1N6M615_9VIBR|nr:S41 family peptidase [Vibrio spartinae]QMV14839.1 carboxy-terminal protease [Vibrio spartinae]SIO94883.1 carboxy-terminal protease [Vibrio spartinae]
MKQLIQISVVASMVILSGCNHKINENRNDDKSIEPSIWVSENYGSALKIMSDSVTEYEFTSDYCVLTNQETLSKETFEKRYQQVGDQFVSYIYPGLNAYPNDYTIKYVKHAELPNSCLTNLSVVNAAENDPLRNLNMFLQTFDQYYYNLDVPGIDWTLMKQNVLGEVSDDSTREQLFDMMSSMIGPLQNGHAYVLDQDKLARFRQQDRPVLFDRLRQEYIDDNGLVAPFSASENAAIQQYIDDNGALIRSIIANQLNLSGGLGEHIIWGKGKSDNIGYLYIDGWSDFVAGNDHAETLAVFRQTMNQVMDDFALTDGMVIDLRFNGGGYAYLARALAEYFVDHQTLGYIKSARDGAGFEPEHDIYLEPQFPGYRKPVSVLISNTTASAAELSALMLSASDQVILIGERTQGMLSGSLGKTLPNGFRFGISNMKTLSADRVDYDQVGIPPAITTSFFTKNDRTNGIDKGLEAAFNWIRLM